VTDEIYALGYRLRRAGHTGDSDDDYVAYVNGIVIVAYQTATSWVVRCSVGSDMRSGMLSVSAISATLGAASDKVRAIVQAEVPRMAALLWPDANERDASAR
jgi:hypothetical protein